MRISRAREHEIIDVGPHSDEDTALENDLYPLEFVVASQTQALREALRNYYQKVVQLDPDADQLLKLPDELNELLELLQKYQEVVINVFNNNNLQDLIHALN